MRLGLARSRCDRRDAVTRASAMEPFRSAGRRVLPFPVGLSDVLYQAVRYSLTFVRWSKTGLPASSGASLLRLLFSQLGAIRSSLLSTLRTFLFRCCSTPEIALHSYQYAPVASFAESKRPRLSRSMVCVLDCLALLIMLGLSGCKGAVSSNTGNQPHAP